MKKLLALILCLLMVLCSLASCTTPGSDADGDHTSTTSPDGSVSTTTNAVDLPAKVIDISQYKLVRPETAGVSLVMAVAQAKKTIDAAAGTSITLASDWVKNESEIDPDAYEILIGLTNRSQSKELIGSIDSTCYIISVVGNKIVVGGANDALSIDALEYFLEHYFVDGKLTVPESLRYVSEPYRQINFISDKKCIYSVIYSDSLDNKPDDKGIVDYQVELAKTVREKISTITGASVTITTDWVKNGTDTTENYEILIGTTNRPETATARAGYDVDEYGVSIIGNKIVVTGWSEKSIALAVDEFCTLISTSVVTDSDGNKNISIFENVKVKKKFTGWKTDIPRYVGGELYGCVTCNNDQYEMYYQNTNETEFNAYRKLLEENGYSLYCENDIEGNLFATYTNKETMIHTYFVKYQKAVRVITGSMTSKTNLPENVNEAPKYEKITESKITQMTLNYEAGNFGMCYIITLEDGSFIVFDGGGSTGNNDHIRLYNLLNKLNERPDGQIVIAAWILTHAHWDHFMGFYNLCKSYGTKVTIEQYIANTPDAIVYYNSNNPNKYMDNGQFDEASVNAGGIKLVKPHTGQKFYVRNAELEVLFTQEDLYPHLLTFFNDSSMIIRMTIGGQTIMWLGDTCDVASKIVCSMYDKYVKSDIVQVAHHGYNGATIAFYKLISPHTAFWPCSSTQFNTQTTSTNTSTYYAVDKFIANNLGVKEIFVAGDGNIQITLPYAAGSQQSVKIAVSAG